MDIESLIFENLLKKGKTTTARVVKKTGFSHAYVHRVFQKLVDGGHLFKTGSTKNARYYLVNESNIKQAIEKVNNYSRVFKSIEVLNADNELVRLKKKMPFTDISKNAEEIFDYAYTEMMNNAIKHSLTQKLNINIEKKHNVLSFEIRDFGIGIFNNIRQSLGLESNNDAIGELLKGKLTTVKEIHWGDGIYYTSKAADTLTIQSSDKKLIYNTLLDDVFVRTIKDFKGTKVKFSINTNCERNLHDIIKKQTGINFAIDEANVLIRLFLKDKKYLSRDEAQKMLAGMEIYKTIVLDFNDVESIGQGFADEVFRVWKSLHPDTEIVIENVNEDVGFWIKRANVTTL